MLLNWTTAIVQVYMVVRKSIQWAKDGTIGGTAGKGFQRFVVPYADSSGWTLAGLVRIRPRGRNNGVSQKLDGPEVNWQLSTENIFLPLEEQQLHRRSAYGDNPFLLSRFNLDFREPKLISPNFFSTMAEIITHHYVSLLVVEVPESLRTRRRSL